MSTRTKAIVSVVGGVILAVAAVFIANTTDVTTVVAPPVTAPVTTSEIPATSLPTTSAATSSAPVVTAAPKPPVQKPPTPIQTPKPVSPATTTAPAASGTLGGTPPPANTPTPSSLNDRVRESVVNIICAAQAAGPVNSISASGVIIDSRGIILTNAHVGQYFLLKDYPTPGFVNCIIRTGSPAVSRYTAELMYLPPSWVAANAQEINSSEPTGDGQHDYALVRITGTINSSTPLPSSFPALPIAVDAPTQGQEAFIAAYPAGFLGGLTIAQDLYQSSAFATIGDVYTFNANTLDLFSVGGTILSQHGSSGGAVTDGNGTLMGLIVTATDAASTAARDLRAITTRYIISDFIQETQGTSLQSYLEGNSAAEAAAFNANVAPGLTAQLVNVLNGH